jgi:hypothetical protein
LPLLRVATPLPNAIEVDSMPSCCFSKSTTHYVDLFSYFYSELYVHLLCEFFIISDYDEMNCNLVSGVFYNVLWSAKFSYICNNHESDVRMNGSVKFIKTEDMNIEHMHAKCKSIVIVLWNIMQEFKFHWYHLATMMGEFFFPILFFSSGKVFYKFCCIL